MSLTRAEVEFLRSQGLSESDVLFVNGMKSVEWQAAAKAQNKKVVVGAPCAAAGHRLRTRKGHCCQCDTKKLAFSSRDSDPGIVYVAGSRSGRLIKIGTCVEVEQRERNLRNQGYGGFRDWKILWHVSVDSGGRVEREALRELRSFQTFRDFVKDGKPNRATELLSCGFSEAYASLRKAAASQVRAGSRIPIFPDYEFSKVR